MKYLQVRELQYVTNALNFNTIDTLVEGGCDLYITKAAATDKRLYKDIENSLESQHKSLLRLSASMSPPTAELVDLDLSRSSPFGPLSQVSSRRTFAYLIATLNASHPDYDFSDTLKPADFKRERSLRRVMSTIDDAIYNLRPRPPGALLASPPAPGKSWKHGSPASPPLGAGQSWGPKAWKAIDREMSLAECDMYSYAPETDPFSDDDTALWAHHYFFFSRERKRVLYLHIRGYSMQSHSPLLGARRMATGGSLRDSGAGKRARFWFGERATHARPASAGEVDMVGSSDVVRNPGDDEVDVDEMLAGSDASFNEYSGGSEDEFMDDGEDEIAKLRSGKGAVRRMSEHIAETMDL